jgi:hypothetical protein
MKMIAAAALLLVTGAADAFAQAESAYTPLDLDKCRHTRGKDVEDYGHWRCRGHGDIAVRVSAGDQRSYVSFGRDAAKELAASQTLAAFNSEGKTIEWRLKRGPGGAAKPFAAIMRWSTTVSAEKGEPVRGQVLVVTRLQPGATCHVGYVDGRANADANLLARRIADEHAASFRCGTDKPIVLGEKGPGFSRPYGD